MTEIALETHSLTVSRGRMPVLSDITFNVSVGEVFALLGGNGAGKSTTLLTFLGFLQAQSGSATVLGRDVSENVKFVREQSAYLPEAANLYPHLSAREEHQVLPVTCQGQTR